MKGLLASIETNRKKQTCTRPKKEAIRQQCMFKEIHPHILNGMRLHVMIVINLYRECFTQREEDIEKLVNPE